MQFWMCSLSPERRALVEEDNGLLLDVHDAGRRGEVPGFLSLGKAWQALATLVGDDDATGLVTDLFLGRAGAKYGPQGSCGEGRILEWADVKSLAAAMSKLSIDGLTARYPSLSGKEVHGEYGRGDLTDQERIDEIESLGLLFARAKTLVTEAAEAKGSLFFSVN